MAVNSLSNSQLNSFFFSSSSCCLISLALFAYSLLNSSTNSFIFSKFSHSSYILVSAVYPFHQTRNLSLSCIFLLFRIFSTLYFSFLSMTIGCGGTTFWPSTCSLYSHTLLTLTTGCILMVSGNSSLIAFVETILFTLYRLTNCSVSFFVLLPFIYHFKSFILSITKSSFQYSFLSLLLLSAYCFIFSCAFFSTTFAFF